MAEGNHTTKKKPKEESKRRNKRKDCTKDLLEVTPFSQKRSQKKKRQVSQ
jgi:hypothetical protein